jgi:hypothetical protein
MAPRGRDLRKKVGVITPDPRNPLMRKAEPAAGKSVYYE